MRLSRLRLTNFRQHADTEIEFDRGLTGIIGPNGAGKSTLLEAIAWALYGGNTARGGNDSIRFARAGARAPVRVELEFELGGHRYRVVRGLSMAELWLDGGEQPIANSVSAVAEMLQRRIGMTRTEFFNTYFTGQKELAVMQSLAAGDRAQFLSRVLGYEKLRLAQELCASRRKELHSEVAGMRAGMPDAEVVARQERESARDRAEALRRVQETEAVERETQAALADIAPRWESAQAGREARQRLETMIAAADGERTALDRAVERNEEEMAQVLAARTALAPLEEELAPYKSVEIALAEQTALAQQDGRRRTLVEVEASLAEEVRVLNEQIERLQDAPTMEEQVTLELEGRRKAAEDALGKLEVRRTEWVRDRQEVETKLRALRTQYAELRDQRDKLMQLGEEGACPTCTRTLGENFRTVLEILERQLETVSADGAYFKSRLEQLEPMPADIAHLDELRKRLQAEVDLLGRRLAKVQMGVQQLDKDRRELTAKLDRLRLTREEIEKIPGGYDAARHQYLDAEFARLYALDTKAVRLRQQLEREPTLLRERETLARQRATLVERREAAEAQLKALQLPEGDFTEIRRLYDIAHDVFARATQEASTARALRDAAEGAVVRAAAARAELERLEQQVGALEREKRVHDELHRAYTDLRTDLNFQMRPEISEIASGLLTELTDARYTELELDDKYRLVVLEEGVPKPVISGGEEDLANLVLRLAISQMIADRAGQSFSLLILDEVFGSLDEVRRQHVIDLLRGLHDRFEQVIVITHIEGVRDGLDRVISIGFDERTGAAVVTKPDPTSLELAVTGAVA